MHKSGVQIGIRGRYFKPILHFSRRFYIEISLLNSGFFTAVNIFFAPIKIDVIENSANNDIQIII